MNKYFTRSFFAVVIIVSVFIFGTFTDTFSAKAQAVENNTVAVCQLVQSFVDNGVINSDLAVFAGQKIGCKISAPSVKTITNISNTISPNNSIVTGNKTLVGILGTITSGNFYPGFNYFYYQGDLKGSQIKYVQSPNKKLIFDEAWGEVSDLSLKTPLEACKKVYPNTTEAETTNIDLRSIGGTGYSSVDVVPSYNFCQALKTVGNNVLNQFCDDFSADLALHPTSSTFRILALNKTPGIYLDWNYLGTSRNASVSDGKAKWFAGANDPYAILCYSAPQTVEPVTIKNTTRIVCEDTKQEMDMFNNYSISLYKVTYDAVGKITRKVLDSSVTSDSNELMIYSDDVNSYNQNGTNNYKIEEGILTKKYCEKSNNGGGDDLIKSVWYTPCVYGLKDGHCGTSIDDPLETQFIPGNIKVGNVSLAHTPVKKASASRPLNLDIKVNGASNPQVNLYYKVGADISSSNTDFTKVSMNLTSGSKNAGTWSGSIPLNSLNIPTTAKNIIVNGQLEGSYGKGTGYSDSYSGTAVPLIGRFWNEWTNSSQISNGSDQKGAGCYSGNCMYFRFGRSGVTMPASASDFFTYVGNMFADTPYLIKTKIKQIGANYGGQNIMPILYMNAGTDSLNQAGLLRYNAPTNSISGTDFISYNGVSFVPDRLGNKLWIANTPNTKTKTGSSGTWKDIEWVAKLPQFNYAPFTELRFAISQVSELYLDNVEMTPMYPGVQYYIEVVDGNNKYYENAWLYKKINAGIVSGNFDPFRVNVLPHYVITSDIPLVILPNQPIGATPVLPVVTGNLVVNTSVPVSGAAVFIDNVLRGSTPLSLGGLTAGTKNILLSSYGYEDYSTSTIITTGSTTTLRIAMTATSTSALPQDNYILNVQVGNGVVTKSPNQTNYISGTNVVLRAVPNTGYVFSSWSGDVVSTTNPITVVINSNKNITANFIQSTNPPSNVLLPPTNLTVTCSPKGDSARIAWDVDLMATGYWPRIKSLTSVQCKSMSGWVFSNGVCSRDNFTGTSFSANINSDTKYNVWIHSGVKGTVDTTKWASVDVYCPSLDAPLVTSPAPVISSVSNGYASDTTLVIVQGQRLQNAKKVDILNSTQDVKIIENSSDGTRLRFIMKATAGTYSVQVTDINTGEKSNIVNFTVVNYVPPVTQPVITVDPINCSVKWSNQTYTGNDGEIGLALAGSTADPRFLCYQGSFYHCGWEMNDYTLAKKALDNQVVGRYKCDLTNKKWLTDTAMILTEQNYATAMVGWEALLKLIQVLR